MKRPDLFILLSTKLPRNPSIRHSGPDGELLFIRGLLWAKENGNTGWIHDFDLPAVAVGLSNVEESVKALIDEELWVEGDGGWKIPSWKAWNDADEEAQKRDQKNREAAAERKRRQREREKAAKEAATEGEAHATGEAPIEPDTSNVVTPNVTRDVTRDGRVTVTHVTELEKEKEIEKEPSLREGVQPPLVGVVGSSTASPPPAEDKPEAEKPNPHAAADSIVTYWWKRNESSTAQSFIAVRSIIRPLVKRGIDSGLLAAAMDAVTNEGRPISQGTLTVAMNRLTRSQTAPQDPYGNVTPLHQSPATRAASAAFDRARRYAEEEGQSLADLFAKEA